MYDSATDRTRDRERGCAVARQERAIQTRERLLAAAAEEFDANGFLGTRLVDIAECARVTRGSLYFHFESKADLASALVAQQYAVWAQYVPTRRQQGHHGVELLMLFAHDLAIGFRDDVASRAATRLIKESAHVEATLPTPFHGWVADVTALLQEARDIGEIDASIDVEQAAWVIVASIFGVQEMGDQLEQRQGICERLDAMWLYLLPGLGVTHAEAYVDRMIAAA